jgi:transposase
VNSAIIVAECRAFAEIREPRQATAFAGLDVVHHESGKFAGKSRISKQGSRLLRRAMVNAAASAIQRKGVFRDFYLRLRQRKLKKKQALIAAARKLLEVTVAVILSDKPFDKGRNVAA